jgi:hypothetical protein
MTLKAYERASEEGILILTFIEGAPQIFVTPNKNSARNNFGTIFPILSTFLFQGKASYRRLNRIIREIS